MKSPTRKKDLPSLALLLVLVIILVAIYVKPQSISSHLKTGSTDRIINSTTYTLTLSEEEKAWLKNNPKIKLGIDRAFPPFGSISSDNEYIGFSADFMRTLEKRLKTRFVYDKDATWNETMQRAKTGHIDVVIGLVNTTSRQQFLNFTKSYISNPTVIINDALNNGYIGSLENLAGKKVAVEKGSYVHGELKQKYPNITIIAVKNTNLALSLVSANTADAYVGNAITASHIIKKFGYKNLSFSGETEYSSDHTIGVTKENKLLLSIMQKGLASISPKSREAIGDFWFGMDVDEHISNQTIVKIATAFCGLLLLLLAWAFSLRKTKNELKLSRQIIQKEANQDYLTGLGNRRKFYRLLSEEIELSKKSTKPFAILKLDLDSFKEINDNFGHSIGDLLIIEAAQRIKICLIGEGFVARLSGDEFLVIIPNIKNRNSIERTARTLLTSISNTFLIEDNEIFTSVSIGITVYPDDIVNKIGTDSSEQLINNVDQALTHSKKMGKNRYSYFNFSMKHEIVLRNQMISDLRDAIKENQFELYYQPIVNLTTNKIRKAEALIRWNHPTKGMIFPDQFIPLAEETGLIIDIGEWVFKKAVSETVQIKEKLGTEFQMSINTSPLQYGKNGMNVSDWFSHIVTSGLSGKDITLEITEGVLMESNESIRNKLYNLRDLDVNISIDDFGTGYSSLSYLKEFDIDFLKIDRSFVQFLTEDSDDLVLIQAIINMAHKLGFKVIAEGIEDSKQRDILAKEGCDFGQGYHFSKPINTADFMELLKGWEENNKTTQQVLPFKKGNTDNKAHKAPC